MLVWIEIIFIRRFVISFAGRKRDMDETKNISVSDNSGEYTLPRQFSIDKEVVYAVLEENSEENSEENTDKNSYVDMIKWVVWVQ